MSSANNNIEIGKNRISYYNEDLRISNISRTWISILFSNYEITVKAYEKAKGQYEERESQKKIIKIAVCVIAIIIMFYFFLRVFTNDILAGILLVIIMGICIYFIYKISKKTILYGIEPPQKVDYPDKYRLNIEMNSGYSVFFTVIGDDGLKALCKLQKKMRDADAQQEVTIINMNDNRITVENNNGIINTGDDVKNEINEKELFLI